jgi:hypothetical protein
MATYVNNLRLKEITTGDEDGTWGTSTNTNLELITDGFSYGTKEIAADANETFTMPDATTDATRSLYLKFTSAVSLTATREITLGPNTVSKTWIIENATTGGQIITIKQGSGATVDVANGSKVMIVTDGAGAGAAVLNANPSETGTGTVTSVGGTGTVNGITLTGTVTSSGNLTLGGTLGSVDLTSQVTGTLPIANGGTGSTSTTYVDLTTNVTGTLPVANGGTGITSFGAGVATFLGTPSSANLATAVTDETGSGALVFATSPTLVTPVLGTPASGTLTNVTGLPPAGVVGTAAILGANTFAALQTFSGSSTTLAMQTKNILENATISATAASGTINFDLLTQSVVYYTANATGNFTVNFRGDASTTLNACMATGDVITCAFMVTNGATAYYNSVTQVDGSTKTGKWLGGAAPTAGNASSVDIYTYTIVKTGASAFTIFPSQTQFA